MSWKKLLMFSILLVTLSACGSSGSSEEVNMDNQEEITTFKLLTQWTDKDMNALEEAKITADYTGIPAKYSMLPVSNGDEKLQLELSSNADYDAVELTTAQYGSLEEQGALLDLKPYIDEFGPNLKANIPEEAWNAVTTEDGAIYGIPRMGASSVLINQVYVRKDILEKEGYEVPQTTDELLDVTCGLADKGYKTPWASGNATYNDIALRGAFGVPNDWNLDDKGNLIYIAADDRYQQFLDFEKQMNDCGAMGNDYETITFDDAVQRFVSGDGVFFPGAYWNAEALATGLETNGLDFYNVVDIVPSFEGPDGFKLTTQASSSIDTITAIPVYQEKYAASIIQYIDKVNDADWYREKIIGKEGTNYEMKDGELMVTKEPTYDNGANTWALPSLGGPHDVIADSTNGNAVARDTKYENGEFQAMGSDGATDYTLAVNDGQKEFGSPNPVAMVIGVESWSKNQLAMSNEIQDFTKLYVTGQKTADDWEGFKTTFEGTYSLSTMTTEMQEKVDAING